MTSSRHPRQRRAVFTDLFAFRSQFNFDRHQTLNMKLSFALIVMTACLSGTQGFSPRSNNVARTAHQMVANPVDEKPAFTQVIKLPPSAELRKNSFRPS